jgi:hypothetical protein
MGKHLALYSQNKDETTKHRDVMCDGPSSLVVIWVGVYPDSTSAETAHKVSQDILELLEKNGVKGVEVEWHETAPVTRLMSTVETESLLPVLFVGDEAGGIDGVASLLSTFHQVANLGTDSAPDAVERGAMDSTKRLGRLVGMSASWPDPDGIGGPGVRRRR